MWVALTSLYASAIIFTAVFLFVLVDDFEPNPRLAALLKAAIIVAAGAMSLITCCSTAYSRPSRSDEHGFMNFCTTQEGPLGRAKPSDFGVRGWQRDPPRAFASAAVRKDLRANNKSRPVTCEQQRSKQRGATSKQMLARTGVVW
jgi:hypothetical protein